MKTSKLILSASLGAVIGTGTFLATDKCSREKIKEMFNKTQNKIEEVKK